jgi:hypothetical protein
MIKLEDLIFTGFNVLVGKEGKDWIRYEIGKISKN